MAKKRFWVYLCAIIAIVAAHWLIIRFGGNMAGMLLIPCFAVSVAVIVAIATKLKKETRKKVIYHQIKGRINTHSKDPRVKIKYDSLRKKYPRVSGFSIQRRYIGLFFIGVSLVLLALGVYTFACYTS